jgi:Na+/melibiose symporter-like transporter
MALYVCSRVAMDLSGALLVFYFTYWLGRPDDFELAMGALLLAVLVSLPFWLRASTHVDKRALFTFGSCGWLATMLGFTLVTPDGARWIRSRSAPWRAWATRWPISRRGLAIWTARTYPITRQRHASIRQSLDDRQGRSS